MCAVRIGKVPGYQKVDCPVGRRWIAREQGGGVSLSATAADITQLLRLFPAFQWYLKLHLANNMLLTDYLYSDFLCQLVGVSPQL